MEKPRFEDIMRVLAPTLTYTSDCITAAKAIENLYANYIPNVVTSPDGNATFDGFRWVYAHDYLVMLCLGSNDIMRYVSEKRKIQAIKELRQITRCGLKEAKDAIEDRRVVWIDDKGNKTYGNGDFVPAYDDATKNDEALQALRDKLYGN